ncbi:MAG: ABC transporter substrate-binding protein [Lachnospiraceae bacterium]
MKKRVLALAMASVMAISLAACGGSGKPSGETTTTEAAQGTTTEAATEAASGSGANFVYATSTFGQKFSPFFYTTTYDGEVVQMVHAYLLASDRGGAIVEKGIEGETRDYNGTDYTYYGLGDVEVVQNDDGTVDYKLTMRDNVTFSDGEKATIDDVIFGIYVLADPTYDGSSTIYALPIKGMEAYRSGMQSRIELILEAGPDGYKANDNYTEEQYNAFWTAFNAGGEKFAQEIVDYCIGNGYNAETDSVAACAANWGYELKEDATAADFFAKIVETYGYDLSDDGINYETAGTSITDFIMGELDADTVAVLQAGVQTGEGADYIEGIERTGDYSMTVHMDSYDATAIYDMAFVVAPMHYYGDASQYDYDAHKFGFTKGDLSIVKAKTSAPMGCGPYTFEGYANGVVTLKANSSYALGAPKTETLLFQEGLDSDYVPGIVTGTYDLAVPSINDETLKAIQDANGGELVGDALTTYLVDYRGYGYLGINADLVNIDDDPGSDASKALRKGFMTLFSVYRDTVINSYYGDRASVIQYPISNTSWAAPKPADEGYHAAYSTDVDGNAIYTDSMTEEERYAAAKEAAIGYFKAAGFKYDEAAGKFTGVDTTYEVMIPGQGQQDHPAYGVAVAASEVLESLGIKLQVNDVGTSVWNNALEGNTAMMWAAAWQASVDPDMTQVYSSANAHGNGTNSNHYSVDDAALDELIKAGRTSADMEYRKSVYRDAMDIIMDWGCELPLYQRKDCTVASTARVVIDTLPADMTPYWQWYAEIEKLTMQ